MPTVVEKNGKDHQPFTVSSYAVTSSCEVSHFPQIIVLKISCGFFTCLTSLVSMLQVLLPCPSLKLPTGLHTVSEMLPLVSLCSPVHSCHPVLPTTSSDWNPTPLGNPGAPFIQDKRNTGRKTTCH